MIKLGKGQVRILHIGDSHLQADFFSGRVRANFQSILPGLQGARGVICPYMKGCPDSYKITYSTQWQHYNILSKEQSTIFANTVYTTGKNASIRIAVNHRNPIKYDFDKVRIYHSPLKPQERIDIDYPSYKKIAVEDGYTVFFLNGYTDTINISVNKTSNDTLFIHGFYFDNEDAGVVYNVTGVNSAEARHYLKIKSDESLKTLGLDLVIISLGTNDCYEASGVESFASNLTELVAKIREQIPDVAILLTTPSDCWYKKKYVNKRMKEARNIIKEVAKQNNCAVWDWYEVMGGEGASSKWVDRQLMQKDRVHLTLNGYYLQGDLLFNALWSEVEKKIFVQ
ncbi:MAG: GDSL-type esterase/lipase family protein [Bacteroidales bacterium]|nr:GDSL-type esterase/lipase family protein [Bacteroidales bacterium]